MIGCLFDRCEFHRALSSIPGNLGLILTFRSKPPSHPGPGSNHADTAILPTSPSSSSKNSPPNAKAVRRPSASDVVGFGLPLALVGCRRSRYRNDGGGDGDADAGD